MTDRLRCLAVALPLIALAAGAGCVGSRTRACSWGLVCPTGMICHEQNEECVYEAQLTDCQGQENGHFCRFPGVDDGICWNEVCRARPTCGDGEVDPGEECDCGQDPDDVPAGCSGVNSDTEANRCRETCLLPHCGDLVEDQGEMCDDGNTTPGDGCAADCLSDERCGSGVVDAALGEVCDDGNTVSGDGCAADCLSDESCGNGVLDALAGEVCDDGNTLPGDGCGVDCRYEAPGVWAIRTAGTFTMGSPPSELGRNNDELPYEVTLTRDFQIQVTEVTRAQFLDVLGYDPTAQPGCGMNCPVDWITWHEAAAYCNAISINASAATCYACVGSGASVVCEADDGYPTPYDCPGYRLPTEAEWEYAARATTTTATYLGDLVDSALVCQQPNPNLDPIAWFCGNAGGALHEVATRDPNAWSLFDMLGNAREWVHDFYDVYPDVPTIDPWGPATGSGHPIRGGSWSCNARNVRAACRANMQPTARSDTIGFRPVRTLPD